MRTLIQVPGGLPVEIKEFEVFSERHQNILKDRTEVFIQILRYLLNVPKLITGDDKMEYIALLHPEGYVHIYFRRKPEIKAFPKDEINFSELGEFISSFNASEIVISKSVQDKEKEIIEWVEKTITRSWMDTIETAAKQLSIRIK